MLDTKCALEIKKEVEPKLSHWRIPIESALNAKLEAEPKNLH